MASGQLKVLVTFRNKACDYSMLACCRQDVKCKTSAFEEIFLAIQTGLLLVMPDKSGITSESLTSILNSYKSFLFSSPGYMIDGKCNKPHRS